MIIKKYTVNNMNEAMTRIRYELGKDAVIISQRKIRKPGFKGFFSNKIIEVTAAVENSNDSKNHDMENGLDALKKVLQKESLSHSATSTENEVISRKELGNIKENVKEDRINNNKPDNLIDNIKSSNTEDSVNVELIKEMKEMKTMINNIIGAKNIEESPNSEIRNLLYENDVEKEVADRVIAMAEKESDSLSEVERVRETIKNMIDVNHNEVQGTLVLVGPTGVGKTTTLAKLAGSLALIEKKKVGLITVDTYRIGAVEQLRTYADIMNIPFKVVFTLKEMETAVQSMSDCDVVLIDTTGRSSKNRMQISELRAFVNKANTENIHLVVSCTTKNKDINSIIEGYKVLNYKNIVITKLDETSTYGSILNILEKGNKPLSFVTTGQDVPEDIKKLTSEHIARLILGEENIC